MKITGIACDVCEKLIPEDDEWFVVKRGKVSVDVCTAECLGKLGRQLKAGEVDMGASSNGNHEEFPCTKRGCDRVFDTQQGLSMHQTRSH